MMLFCAAALLSWAFCYAIQFPVAASAQSDNPAIYTLPIYFFLFVFLLLGMAVGKGGLLLCFMSPAQNSNYSKDAPSSVLLATCMPYLYNITLPCSSCIFLLLERKSSRIDIRILDSLRTTRRSIFHPSFLPILGVFLF